MSDPIVRIEHVRAVSLCTRGTRVWFARNGLDFRKFLADGIPASTIEATGDALGATVVKHVRSIAEGGA